ncbi:uncharacterized protein CDV56_100521 [Aspergillus thermomutatus]|uniref:Uncharacterized protein n=1 Tax=Aspergillus thermomutatus TaxID=41047 RepID=A0A397FY07_ASPTH|nr:uncharacterized protein CDV56_100521 [Aspergillus thermomutatus]RHZ43631.1 hypothetical protein CDV56_100521 [Aspergillus thermomutatus]
MNPIIIRRYSNKRSESHPIENNKDDLPAQEEHGNSFYTRFRRFSRRWKAERRVHFTPDNEFDPSYQNIGSLILISILSSEI